MKNVEQMLSLFDCAEGERLYRKILTFVNEESLREPLASGTLLGLSGGADSVFCLLFLLRYAHDFNAPRPICVHVEHGIRGETAQRDAAFSMELCRTLGVECFVRHVDVPSLAKERKEGMEEAARNARYCEFRDIISGREHLDTIVTAHNATDQLETVLQRILRGTGACGLCGIHPKNGNIIRPLLPLTKDEIRSALDKSAIPYMTDETNFDTQYTRNYIRNQILPSLQRLTKSPEVSLMRLTRNLRMDEDYFSRCVDSLMQTGDGTSFSREMLCSLHPALFARLIQRMCAPFGTCHPEAVHIDAIRDRLSMPSDFSISLPGDCCFVSEGERVFVRRAKAQTRVMATAVRVSLNTPVVLEDFGCTVYVGDGESVKSFLNVYKILTQQRLSSVIMEGELTVRARAAGDRIRFGGMTRRLKTLLNAAKIPPSQRDRIPVFEDARGIVYVPHIGVRDDAAATSDAPTVFILQHI